MHLISLCLFNLGLSPSNKTSSETEQAYRQCERLNCISMFLRDLEPHFELLSILKTRQILYAGWKYQKM